MEDLINYPLALRIGEMPRTSITLNYQIMKLEKLSSLKTQNATLRSARTFESKGQTYTTGIMSMKDAKGKVVDYRFFEVGVFVDGALKVETRGKYVNVYQ